MTRARYDRAEWVGNAGAASDGNGWGPLPDFGRGATGWEQVRDVLHTTETNHLPGYNGGRFAPHFTYFAARRRWFQHGHTDRRMGTLLGRSRTGVIGNEISMQLEIVCYSDVTLAGQRGGLWVGNFTDDHYADLADWVRWTRDTIGIAADRAYGPSNDFRSFKWGKNVATRMTASEWLEFGGGVTGHGAVPGNDHWDTGELDLHRIVAESKAPRGGPSELIGVARKHLAAADAALAAVEQQG